MMEYAWRSKHGIRSTWNDSAINSSHDLYSVDTLGVLFFRKERKTHCSTENVCTHLPANSYLLIYDCENAQLGLTQLKDSALWWTSGTSQDVIAITYIDYSCCVAKKIMTLNQKMTNWRRRVQVCYLRCSVLSGTGDFSFLFIFLKMSPLCFYETLKNAPWFIMCSGPVPPLVTVSRYFRENVLCCSICAVR